MTMFSCAALSTRSNRWHTRQPAALRPGPDSARQPSAVWLLVSLMLLLAAPSTAQSPHGVEAIPNYEGSDVDSLFYLDLGDGSTHRVDRLDSPPPRGRRLQQNVFSEIGRPTDQAAGRGEILLGPIRDASGSLQAVLFVESSTGYVAFFDEPGRGSLFGSISTAIGRPFEPIAAPDRHYALLMRRGNGGRTEGAYLYHGPSGTALHLDGLRKLEPDGAVVQTPPWPTISGQIAAAEIQSSREVTLGYLLVDIATGTLHRVNLVNPPDRISIRPYSEGLYDTLNAEPNHSTNHRLSAVGLQGDNGATESVFFIDAASGAMGVMLGVEGSATVLQAIPRNLYDVLGQEVSPSPRSFTLVPADDGDETTGVYVIDSLSRQVVLVDNPEQPGATLLRPLGTLGR